MRTFTVLAIAFMSLAVVSVRSTPLDDYVNTPDSHYSYRYLTQYSLPGLTVHVLNMTSQKWLTESETTNPIWWHYMFINIPDTITYTDTVFFWIGAEDNNPQAIPSIDDDTGEGYMISLAETTGSVTALIQQIPNQPIVFQDDPQQTERTEDEIIAWTWMKFIQNGSNPEILLRLPMTKAVVRGMDTVTDYVLNVTGNDVQKFVVAGKSKRGWTTWTTAAVDKRVVGMVPTVMDMLNMQANLRHHFRSLGGWTFAFYDYYVLGITSDLDNPNFPKMQAIVDPLTYNDRYTMPKLVVTGSSDEFFLPDDSYYYYDQLTGPKYLRIVPNVGHSLVGPTVDYVKTIRGFYLNIVENVSYPDVTWTRTQTTTGGKISVQTSKPPLTVTVYHATTLDDKRRDFRRAVLDVATSSPVAHPVVWSAEDAVKISDLEYEAEVAKPASGWAAFFVELTFDGAKNSTLEFTTEACIVPDTFPVDDCQGASCFGTLV